MQTNVSFRQRVIKDYKRNKYLLLMLVPILAYYLVFHYAPMYGALIAFKDYSPRLGVMGSRWVGFKNFENFFNSAQFGRILPNTIKLSLYQILFGFPAPLLLALVLNEVRRPAFKRTVQTISYMPHFISVMVLCGMLVDFCSTNGILTNLVSTLSGTQSKNLLLRPELFRTIYVASGIWQEVGFGSIVYLSALSGIDEQLYEAATIDGASRGRQLWHVTLPGVLPTVTVMFLLRIGRMMNVGYEKVLLLYNASTYETAEIISTYVYKRGMLDMDYSLGAAVDLFNSAINLVLLFSFNWLSKKLTENGLF
ncbi:ABC transporter permease subunit [Eubacteriales bacterium OttesenSCG-928-A19]|nr:ABC transporter permease subunit [Eubacteriales bacterium OttesenSCG-928-A19]